MSTVERAAIETLIAARLALHEAETQVTDNALVIATAERTLQQAKMAKGIVAYRVEVKRKVSLHLSHLSHQPDTCSTRRWRTRTMPCSTR